MDYKQYLCCQEIHTPSLPGIAHTHLTFVRGCQIIKLSTKQHSAATTVAKQYLFLSQEGSLMRNWHVFVIRA